MALLNTLLIAMDRLVAEDGTQEARYALLRGGRRIVESGRCAVDDLTNQRGARLRASVASPLSHLERVGLDAFNRRLVPFAARRYLDGESVFTESYRLRTRPVHVGEGRADTYLVAMAEDDIALAAEAIPRDSRPTEILTAAEVAIAALVGQATREPTLVHWARGSYYAALLVDNGQVRWRRAERVYEAPRATAPAEPSVDSSRALVESDPYAANQMTPAPQPEDRATERGGNSLTSAGVGSFANERWERFQRLADSAEGSLSAEAERALRHRIALGDLLGMPLERETSPLERQQLEARLGSLLRGLEGNTLLREPELYGLVFAPRWTDMQDSDYRHQVLASRIAVPVTAVAITAGVVFGSIGWLEQRIAAGLDERLEEQQQSYQQRLSTARDERPSPQHLEELAATLELYHRERRSLRLDHLLAWVSEQIPASGHIRRLEVTPRDSAQSGRGRSRRDDKEPAEQGPDAPFAAQLEIALQGDYETTRGLAEVVLDRLGERVRLSSSSFAYEPDGNGEGLLTTSLQFQAQDMAPQQGN